MSETGPLTILPDAREVEFRQALEKAGCRYTRQRAAVFAYLIHQDAHPTADLVYAAVRQQLPHISLATVYKALDALVAAGLATKLPTVNGPTRYDGHGEAHYHLHCVDTDEIHDLPLPYDPQLLDKVCPELLETLRRQGFQVTGHRLEILGRFQGR